MELPIQPTSCLFHPSHDPIPRSISPSDLIHRARFSRDNSICLTRARSAGLFTTETTRNGDYCGFSFAHFQNQRDAFRWLRENRAALAGTTFRVYRWPRKPHTLHF